MTNLHLHAKWSFSGSEEDMGQGLEVKKESPANLAVRVFDGMESGILDITTDILSDYFADSLKPNFKAIDTLKKAFNRETRD